MEFLNSVPKIKKEGFNSVTKLFLVNPKDKILKRISLPSKSITTQFLIKNLKF